MFETFEHTADVGLRITAASLEALFAESANGLMSLLVENPGDVQPAQTEAIELSGTEHDYLLFDWLNELLFRFESRQMLYRDFRVTLCDAGLEATIRGEPVDRSRHRLAHEVKAITYHGLRIEQSASGWLAEMILDI